MSQANPYDAFDKKFCKLVIKTTSGDKSLKGFISICDHQILIKGDYQQTIVNISDVVRITTLEVNENVK